MRVRVCKRGMCDMYIIRVVCTLCIPVIHMHIKWDLRTLYYILFSNLITVLYYNRKISRVSSIRRTTKLLSSTVHDIYIIQIQVYTVFIQYYIISKIYMSDVTDPGS